MKADTRTEAAVFDVLNAFAASYASRDIESVMGLHAADPDVVVFVEGHTYMGSEQIRALVEGDLAGFGAMVWTFAKPSVSAVGAVAWLTADATVTGQTGGQAVPLGVYRFTWVLEQRGERWLIVHAHVSAVASEI